MSTILKHLTAGLPQLNLDGKAKTPEVAFGKAEQEHVVVLREGELLQVYAKSNLLGWVWVCPVLVWVGVNDFAFCVAVIWYF